MERAKPVLLSVLFIIVLNAPASFAQGKTGGQSNDQQQLLALDEAIGKAIAEGDVGTYDKLTADDFQFVNGAGAILSKAERLALLKKGPTPGFRSFDQSIRFYGNVAIVTGRQGNGSVRFTRVWIRQGNEWRLVSSTAVAIQEPKPF